MQWGTETEPVARDAYAMEKMCIVEETGLVSHPNIDMSGASPDGLIGDDGLIEIKCPNTSTHIDTLLSGKIKDCYIKQMQWQMACTGRKWCDFVSFDPRMPSNLEMWVKRIDRDDDFIAEVEAEVITFMKELIDKVSRLEKLAA